MSKVRIGIIGCGAIGSVHADAFAKVADAEVVALCDVIPDKLKAKAERHHVAKTYDDYHELLADPEIDATRVAGVMGCSRSLADLRFREATGHTIREEIQERRIESAKGLLADPNRGLSAIPSLCGCLSQTTFMRFFKSRVGKTMSDFRRELLSGK